MKPSINILKDFFITWYRTQYDNFTPSGDIVTTEEIIQIFQTSHYEVTCSAEYAADMHYTDISDGLYEHAHTLEVIN